MSIYLDITQAIGNTPMVRINRLNKNKKVELWAKLESCNPGGSVKDRIGLRMVLDAQKKGKLDGNKTILEATSGNTGVGLAMVCAVKGIPLEIIMSEAATDERKQMVRAFGATLTLTPKELGTDGAIVKAKELMKDFPEKYYYVDQFANEVNSETHYKTTAEEIYRQANFALDYMVITIGSCGTINGISRALREIDPAIKIVCVKPKLDDYIPGMQNMEAGLVPKLYNPNVFDEEIEVCQKSACSMMKKMASNEGIFCGCSGGAAISAALEITSRMESGKVIALLPDGGEKYFSMDLFGCDKKAKE